MLYFTRLKALAIILTALVVCLCAVPNFFPETQVKTWPLWAQRHLVLGLDLQGGSYLLLEVDSNYIKKERLDGIRDDGRRVLREDRIQFPGGINVRNDACEVRIGKETDLPTALSKLRELSQPLGGLLGSNGQRSLEVNDAGGGLIRLTKPQAALTDRIRQTIEQSIQIVEKRVNELGTVEPVIQRQGSDRILVQVPGLQDPTRLKALLGQTAKMEFRMVDESVPPDAVAKGAIPQDDEILPEVGGQKLALKKQVLVSGGDLSDAQTAFDQRSSEPVVSFKFNSAGARKFAQATTENVGQRFAIVLDNQVISAPVIREPIIGGQGQISGSFTVQSANDLSILLRAGALPAPLTVIEERTVGPGLGQDSIEKGEGAAEGGVIMVIVFMLVTYRLFGLFANIAVTINVAMIFGVLSLLNATLTLPGIAGIVLTVGIAVDSNVLIYERIPEEIRGGRNAISAIDG